MHVVMLSKAVVVGTYQRKLEELARLPDIELTVIAPPLWRDNRGETRLERVYVSDYRLVEIPILLPGHFHAHCYPRLARELNQAQPDLIHIDEEPYNLATWQAMHWAVRHYVPALFFTWQNLLRHYPPPFKWFERYNYRHATCAIAGNQEAKRVLRAKGFSKPISVIPQFGVDPELFKPATDESSHAGPFQTGEPGLVIGYAGGLIPEKGLDVLLRAVAVCNRRLAAIQSAPGHEQRSGSTSPCRLLIAGEGPQQPTLEALAAQLGIQDAVTFLGRVGSIAMPGFYASLDVLVLPSRTMPNWKEQFGRVLIEAMACGVPVVGSDSGEIPHVIGEAGWTFPEGDFQRLAAILAKLAADPELRRQAAVKGRSRVLACYTQQQIAIQTYQVYKGVLAKAANARRAL